MKKTRAFLAFSIALSLPLLAFANGTPRMTKAQMSAKLKQVSAQAARLEKEVQVLNAEMHLLKSQEKVAAKKPTSKAHKIAPKQPTPKKIESGKKTYSETTGVPPKYRQGQHYSRGITVTTSPVLGLRTDFLPYDLLSEYPSMNEDLRLLEERQKLEKEEGLYPTIKRPMLVIGGTFEGLVLGRDNFAGVWNSDVTIAKAELDFLALVSPWATALFSVDFDPDAILIPGTRTFPTISNSRLFLSRGFLTIGNLNKAPVYVSLGQMYVPFGRYMNGMITTPITEALGRTRTRAILLGFSHSGVYASAYAFKGDSRTAGDNNITNWGVNLGFKKHKPHKRFDAGVGFINNIADSQGMQDTGGGAFPGFGEGGTTPSGGNSELLAHYVPAVDVHSEINVDPFVLISEYIQTLRAFAASNLSFNDHGAQPAAFDVEGIYKTTILDDKPIWFGASYERSWQAYALNLPQQSIIAYVDVSFWKDTILKLEYRHDINYPVGTTGSGQGIVIPTKFLGRSANAVTMQMGLYF